MSTDLHLLTFTYKKCIALIHNSISLPERSSTAPFYLLWLAFRSTFPTPKSLCSRYCAFCDSDSKINMTVKRVLF